MTVEATSSAAYNSFVQSGAAATQREFVKQTFERRGPLAEFEVAKLLPDMKLTSFRARRRELNKAGVVGILPYTREDPDTGKEQCVWGLIGVHEGAVQYYPTDTIAIRIKGETYTIKFEADTLATMSASLLGDVIYAAIDELLDEESDSDD